MVMLTIFLTAALQAQLTDGPLWKRHAIDDGSRGADGVKLADIDEDGDQDIVCGWEEGGVIRVYLNPGPEKLREPWPRVEVGQVASPEDAIFGDLDGDGSTDVVSFAEGKTRKIHVHWAPKDRSRFTDAEAWTSEEWPWPGAPQMWMQGVALDLDGENGPDLVTASKGAGASVSVALSPEQPRDLAAWSIQKLRSAAWIMSVEAEDIDGDGDKDLLIVDRKGEASGVFWLKNPGPEAVKARAAWEEHAIGALGLQPMFLDVADVNGDGLRDVAVAVKMSEVRLFLRKRNAGVSWEEQVIELGGEIGDAKGVALADCNADSRVDIVFTCENARVALSGIVWLEQTGTGEWLLHPLGGPEGLKYDYPVAIDLDGDGDLDVLTCEERDQLGVIWYENPHRG